MNALETILLRKSIPLMEEPKPNKQQLKKIYKAGLREPDHGGLNPWKFIEVSGDDRIKLGKKFVKIGEKRKNCEQGREKTGLKVFFEKNDDIH